MARNPKKSAFVIPESWLEGTVIPNRDSDTYHWALEFKKGDKLVKVVLSQIEAWNFDVEAQLKVWFEFAKPNNHRPAIP